MTTLLQATEQLTAALKMVVNSLQELNYDEFYILGLVNLIIQGHINDDGTFTDQYVEMAKSALISKQIEDAYAPQNTVIVPKVGKPDNVAVETPKIITVIQ